MTGTPVILNIILLPSHSVFILYHYYFFFLFIIIAVFLFYLFIYFCLFAFSRATTSAYGGSQARGLIGAVAAVLHHSHSNARSEPCLRPTPQLTVMPDP